MYYVLIPAIAALTGLLLHFFLFRFLLYKLLPARVPQLTAAAAQYLSEQLGDPEAMLAGLTGPEALAHTKPFIEEHMDHFLRHKLAEKIPALAMFIGEKTIEMIKKGLMDEIDLLLPALLQRSIGNMSDQLDIKKIVAARVPASTITPLLQQQLSGWRSRILWWGVVSGGVCGLMAVLLSHIFI
jgi:hypothetical protein